MVERNRPARASLKDRARYLFDKSMSAGTIALIGWLTALSLAIIVVASVFIVVMRIAPEGEQAPHDLVETGWESLMRTIDAGTIGGDVGWPYRIVMLVVTVAGIFIFSALIGVLSSGLAAKIDELRKGRSRVLEQGHTVILNWSPSIVDIVKELAQAHTGGAATRIVILATRDKVEMEDEIAGKAPKLRGVRVTCRSGDPCDLNDLGIVNPSEAKSIIVLAPEGEDPDAQVIKTILAITNGPAAGGRPHHVVAEVRDAHNAELARAVGGADVQLVLADELISRILVQSTRQSGLSAVFAELLGFDGSEIYTAKLSALAGMTFGDALGTFESGSLIGLCDDKSVRINPPMDTVIGPGDQVVVVAEDRSHIRAKPNKRGAVDAAAIREPHAVLPPRERILMLGWNRKGPAIVQELARFVQAGSELAIVADTAQFELQAGRLVGVFPNLAITCATGDTTRASVLAGLDTNTYDHVIVLGYTDTMSMQSADTRTLVTLLQLRKLAEASGRHINVVSEMADARNRALAEVTRADDFVVSNQLVSLMLAQASENPFLSAIFAELLDEEGSEVYIRPITDYVAIDRPVTFYTIVEAARRRGEVAFGFKETVSDRGARNMGGVIINPRRAEARTFNATDSVVVLARG
jgi:voltage-gated potassium channel Kch